MGNMAGNLSSKVPPFSPGILRRYPELLRSSRDMAPSRVPVLLPCGRVAVWPWETSPGLPAQPAAQTPTNTPSTRQRQLIPSSVREPSFGRGRVGKDKVWTASEACTSPASSSSPPFFFAPRVCVVSCPAGMCCLDNAAGKFEVVPLAGSKVQPYSGA